MMCVLGQSVHDKVFQSTCGIPSQRANKRLGGSVMLADVRPGCLAKSTAALGRTAFFGGA